MKKKKYIKPAIEVVEMESVSMFASSDIKDGSGIGGDPDKEFDEELSNRRRNYWDEVGGW